jgi:hypothetical protein
MPMVEPGGSGADAPRSSGIVRRGLGDVCRLSLAPGFEPLGEIGILQRQDLRGQDAGVGGAGLADRQCADR